MNVFTYTSLIDCYGKHGNFDKVEQYVDDKAQLCKSYT